MRISITDEFLLKVFKLTQKMEDLFRFLGMYNKREIFVPPEYNLRGIYGKLKAKTQFQQFMKYLLKKGYIKAKSLEPLEGIVITDKGIEKIFNYLLKKGERKLRKDGKMIMVIFDIPEEKKFLRDFFREKLKILGFKLLQKSIWVSPLDVLKETQLLAQRLGIEKHTKIFLIQKISF